MKKLIPKVTSYQDLANKAKTDERYQRLAIAAAENIGGPDCKGDYKKALQSLYDHWCSLVGEYGDDESDAEQSIVDEINFVRDCI